jgi:hypothetical protein
MKDLLGNEVRPELRQGDLLAGPCGLGVESVWRVVDGVPYVQTPSGYVTRADGTGLLHLEDRPEGREPPLLAAENPSGIRKSSQRPTDPSLTSSAGRSLAFPSGKTRARLILGWNKREGEPR